MEVRTRGIYFCYFCFVLYAGVLPKCLSVAHFVPREMPEFIALGPEQPSFPFWTFHRQVFRGPVIVGPSTPSTEDCSKFNAEDCLDDLQTFMRLTALPFTSDPSELNRLCKLVVLILLFLMKLRSCPAVIHEL
ncbi:hypothetical protein CDAR_100032 [Caerostris darwini]|uniref:Uncharacterized protein n=1 Tax=Caerostris darwini TaxID=1538125 RepID=A0AAV4RIJ0_9ARAC|nr:hypothetical protein CDAR_100032 [Caerostris darwini]